VRIRVHLSDPSETGAYERDALTARRQRRRRGAARGRSGPADRDHGGLRDGGVTAVEITADTPNVAEKLSEVAGSFDDEVVVGTGTVLDSETARTTLMAGAEFVVSPSLHEDVIETCNRYGAVSAPA